MGNTASRVHLEPGDIVYRPILGDSYERYFHYGVYVRDNYVIHSINAGILKEHVNKFAFGSVLSKERYENQLGRDKTIQTAEYFYKNPSEWGDFCPVFNNCEHFASFCATGQKLSGHIQMGAAGAVIGVGVRMVLALLDSITGSKK